MKRKAAKSSHNRKKSRDAPHVSDMVKNARSTMKVKQKMKGALIDRNDIGDLAPMILGRNLAGKEEFKRSRHDSVAINTDGR